MLRRNASLVWPYGGRLRAKKNLIRDGTTVDVMVRAIADRIVVGDLKPGGKLDEATLAERFAVSRTPIREALAQLAAMGLVDRRPNRGAIVTAVSQTQLASMFESMAELEGICARFSALRMTSSERAALESGHQASSRLVHLGKEEEYEAYNTEFHSCLYRGAHNTHVFELVTLTRSRLAPFRRAQFRLSGRLAKSWDEHDAIVTAIMRGDGNAAGEAARVHVNKVSNASLVFVSGSSD